jgi:hypothetical protein
VYKKWYLKFLNKSEEILGDNCANVIKHVIALCSAQPRALEIAVVELSKLEIDDELNFAKIWLRNFLNVYNARYRLKSFENQNVLFALLYGHKVELDDRVSLLIRKSILTNSIADIDITKTMIVPRTSAIAFLNTEFENDLHYLESFKSELNLAVMKHLNSSAEALSLIETGDILEGFTHVWLKIRLAAAAANKMDSISVKDLFGFSKFSEVPRQFMFNITLPNKTVEVKSYSHPKIQTNTNNTKEDYMNFLGSVSDITLDDENPFVVFKSPKGTPFDGALLFRVYESGSSCDKYGFIFIECKSRKEVFNKTKSDGVPEDEYDLIDSLKTKQSKQGWDMSLVAIELKNSHGYVFSPVIEALAEKRGT